MGTPLPPPPDPSAPRHCHYCEDHYWGLFRSPSVVRIVFHFLGLYPGFPIPPNDLPFMAYADPDYPCWYTGTRRFSNVNWRADYWASYGRVWLYNYDPPLWEWLWGEAAACTKGPFPNTNIFPNGYPIGGHAYVLDLPILYVTDLAAAFGVDDDPLALFDDDVAADPARRVIRLTRRTSPSSCLFHIEPPAA